MLSAANTRRIWRVAILPVVDFLFLVLGIGTVYLIRYRWFDDNFLGVKQVSGLQYLQVSLLLALSVVIIYSFLGLYEIYRKRKFWQTFFSLFFGILMVLLSLITFFFFYEYNREVLPRGVPVSRFILLTGGFFALYAVLLGRGLVWAIEQILYQLKIGKINIAVIGDKKRYLQEFIAQDQSVRTVYHYDNLNEQNLEDLRLRMKSGDIAEIYLFGQQNKRESNLAIWAERYKISFIFSPEGFSQFESFGLKPIVIGKKVFLELIHSNLDGWQIVLKRVLDILVSSLWLLLFSWLYIIIAIAIKIDSPGPIFYLSERVGPNGRVFKIWKFRRLKQEFCTSESNPESLKIEADLIAKQDLRKDGILYKIKDDPRMTRVGKILERYSLDELPQFFNVLKGDMSLVGPRPHQPREVAKYSQHHYKVLNIKPGITGLAQINGRSDLQFEQEVSFDKFYIEHWSFWLDLSIILRTPLVIFLKPHAG